MSADKINILMIDGRTLTVLVRLVPRTVIHRYSLVAILLAFVALFLLKPYEYLERLPSWFSAPFLMASVVTMLCLITGLLVATGLYFQPRRVITLPATSISTVIVIYVTDHMLLALELDPLMPIFDFFVKAIFTTIFAEVVIFFYLNYIYPHVFKESGITIAAEIETPTAIGLFHIDAGGIPVAISDVIYIEAQQSYINIVTQNRSYLIRRKFSDCVAGIPDDFGKQVHRSYWVNRGFVADLQRLNQSGFQVILKSGMKIPVSRARSTEIEKWFAGLQK